MDRVNREELIQTLESVQPGLSKKEFLEQSDCFIFRKGWVKTFNDEVYCSRPSGLDESLTAAVAAEPLLNVLRHLESDAEVTVAMPTKAQLVVSGARGRSGIRAEGTVTLPYADVEKPGEWTKLPADFTDAVQAACRCAGKDESKPHLTCIHLHPDFVEAYDDIQACRWAIKTGFKKAALVRHQNLSQVVTLGLVSVSETASWVHFKARGNLTVSCRRYDADYPDLTKVFKPSGEKVTLPKGLAAACEGASIFSVENESDLVLVHIKPGGVQVRGDGISGWYEEPRKLKYSGGERSFLIPPQTLVDIVKRHNEVVLGDKLLHADAGNYVYISCLRMPAKNGEK
jgi:hypothetical protein